MAQVTDRNIGANPTGFDMRTEINNIIAALESDNSGTSEPLNTVAYMKWLDTSNATYYYYKERNHDNTAWVTLFRYTVATKIMEVVSNGVVLSQTNIASEIHASSSKTTPVDADEIGLIDSASTFNLKKLTWANLKATLKTYFNTLYQVVLVSGTNIKTINSNSILGSGDLVVGETTWTANDTRAMTALNATGEAPIYACRAWVNFNGTGTVAIRASGNVSSITDNGTGNYTVNFTTAMADTNFAAVTGCGNYVEGSLWSTTCEITSQTITSIALRLTYNGGSGAVYDNARVTLAIFR